jgi:4-hydroxybenzoate polyprenyltransferase
MKPIEVISHIVLSVSLIASIIMGFYGMSEHGVAPFWILLTLGGSFVLGTQIMFISTGE